MKKTISLAIITLSFACFGLQASACYVGPGIKCCHPMIGCDFDSNSFLTKLDLYKATLVEENSKEVESQVFFVADNAETIRNVEPCHPRNPWCGL